MINRSVISCGSRVSYLILHLGGKILGRKNDTAVTSENNFQDEIRARSSTGIGSGLFLILMEHMTICKF